MSRARSELLIPIPVSLRGRNVSDEMISNLKLQLHPVKRQLHSVGNVALVASCGRSWQMCVKNARFGFTVSTILSDFSTVECVG